MRVASPNFRGRSFSGEQKGQKSKLISLLALYALRTRLFNWSVRSTVWISPYLWKQVSGAESIISYWLGDVFERFKVWNAHILNHRCLSSLFSSIYTASLVQIPQTPQQTALLKSMGAGLSSYDPLANYLTHKWSALACSLPGVTYRVLWEHTGLNLSLRLSHSHAL